MAFYFSNLILQTAYKIKKGSNWFSIKKKYIANILEFDDSIFMYSFLADELYIQTILGNFEDSIDNKNGNCRYIDWDRGRPYVFTEKDARELSNLINTKYSLVKSIILCKILYNVLPVSH